MTRRARWAIPALLVALAAVVAVWPRDPAPPPATTTAGATAAAAASTLTPLPPPTPGCPNQASGPKPTGPLGSLTVPCLTAPGLVHLGPALEGKMTLVNLWASWCAPCRQEMPALSSYAAQLGADPVLGVDVKDDPAAARTLIRDLGLAYPSVSDPDVAIERALHTPQVVPLSYLVLPDGSVRRITDPPVFHTADQISAAIARYSR